MVKQGGVGSKQLVLAGYLEMQEVISVYLEVTEANLEV